MKTRGSSRLTDKKRRSLVLGLCQCLTNFSSSVDVASALTDLLTPKELETIAKRLEIADLLVKGASYEDIRKELKVGYATIARVNTWLNLSGKGYKLMLSKKKKPNKSISDRDIYDPYSWHNIKRRYSMHFWPHLVLDEIMKKSDKREKKKIEQIMERLDLKRHYFKGDTNKMFYELFAKQSNSNDDVAK